MPQTAGELKTRVEAADLWPESTNEDRCGVVDNPHMAAVHLDRVFQIDPSCTGFIVCSPAFAPLRTHREIQEVVRKHGTTGGR